MATQAAPASASTNIQRARDIAAVAGDFFISAGSMTAKAWDALDLRSQVIWANRFGFAGRDFANLVGPGPCILGGAS